MKKLISLFVGLIFCMVVYSQSVVVVCPCCGQKIAVNLNVTAADSNAVVTSVAQETQQNNTQQSFGRCKAKTAKGTQCSRMAKDDSGYCWQHKAKATEDGNSSYVGGSGTTTTTRPTSSVSTGRCRATTARGTRCTRAAKSNGYCWQHGGQ